MSKKEIKKYETIKNSKFKLQAGLIAVGMSTAFSGCGIYDPENENKKSDIYTTKITDAKNVFLKDKDGNVISTYKGNDGIENNVILLNNPKKTSSKYQAIVVDENGKLVEGYLNQDDIKLNDVETHLDVLQENGQYSISIVSSPIGAYVTKSKTTDKGLEDALLKAGTYILAGKEESSDESSRHFSKVLYYEDDTETLKTGYIVSDYVFNTEKFDLSREFKIQETNGKGLAFRSDPSKTDSIVKKRIAEDDLVYVVPNVKGIVDSECDWLYVAHKDVETGDVELGWVAATQRINGKEKHYIAKTDSVESIQVENKVTQNSNSNYGTYEIIGGKDFVNKINLKKDNKLFSETIDSLPVGTAVYALKSDMDSFDEKSILDNFKMVEVKLKDGREGYVFAKYLKEKSIDKIVVALDVLRGVKMHNEGFVDGVLGIDIDPKNMSTTKFKELLSTNIKLKEADISGKISYVYIKMGGSSYGRGKMQVIDSDGKIKLAGDFAKICDELKIPYGFYYYDQAITKKETNDELNHIEKGLKTISGTFNILPFVIDSEANTHNNKPERLYAYVYEESNENKRREKLQEITNLKLEMVNSLRNKGIDATFYTNYDGLNYIIDYRKLTDADKEKLWVVNPYNSETHSKRLTAQGIVPGVENRQIALDVKVKLNSGSSVNCDIDFLDLKAMEKYLELANMTYQEKWAKEPNRIKVNAVIKTPEKLLSSRSER